MDDMKNAGLFIHEKGGSAAECKHYKPLFLDCEVFGRLDQEYLMAKNLIK